MYVCAGEEVVLFKRDRISARAISQSLKMRLDVGWQPIQVARNRQGVPDSWN